MASNLNILAGLKLKLDEKSLKTNLDEIKKSIESKLEVSVNLKIKGVEEYKKAMKDVKNSTDSINKSDSGNKKKMTEIDELILKYKALQITSNKFINDAKEMAKSSDFENKSLQQQAKLLGSLEQAENGYIRSYKSRINIRNQMEGKLKSSGATSGGKTELQLLEESHGKAIEMNKKIDFDNMARMNKAHGKALEMNKSKDAKLISDNQKAHGQALEMNRKYDNQVISGMNTAHGKAIEENKKYNSRLLADRNKAHEQALKMDREMLASARTLARQRAELNGSGTSTRVRIFDQPTAQSVQAGMENRLAGLGSRIGTATRSGSIDAQQLARVNAQFAELQGRIGSIGNNGMARQWNTDYARLTGTVRGFNDVIEEGNRGLSGYLKNVVNISKKFLDWIIVGNILMGTLRQFQDAVKYIYDMNTAMVDLEKVTSFTNEQMVEMKDTAIEMGKELGKSSVEIMKSFAEFGRVVKDMESIKELSNTAVMASNVTSMSPEDAAKALNTTMIAFKMSAKDSMVILDQWNELQNRHRVSAEDMADSIGKVGAVAEQTGVSLNKLNAYTTAITSVSGATGSEAGTTIILVA